MICADDRRDVQRNQWHKLKIDHLAIGLDAFTVEDLTGIAFLETAITEPDLNRGQASSESESVKVTSDLYSRINGDLVEANQQVMDNLSLVNQDSCGRDWLVKVRPNESKQLEQLLTTKQYQKKFGTGSLSRR